MTGLRIPRGGGRVPTTTPKRPPKRKPRPVGRAGPQRIKRKSGRKLPASQRKQLKSALKRIKRKGSPGRPKAPSGLSPVPRGQQRRSPGQVPASVRRSRPVKRKAPSARRGRKIR